MPCKLARNYKNDFGYARIVIDRLSKTYDRPVDIITIFEALHEQLRYKGVDLSNEHERYITLSEAYYDIFKKIRRELLFDCHLIKDVEPIAVTYKADSSHNEVEYKLDRYTIAKEILEEALSPHQSNPQQTIIKKATDILSRRLVQINAAESVTKIDKRNKIKKAFNSVNQQLKNFKFVDTNDRTVYHWYKCILLLKNTSGDIFRQVSDFITYIRYNNIKFAITEVEEGELYQWEDSSNSWNALLELLRNDKFVISLPRIVDSEEYQDACNRLLSDLSALTDGYELDNDIFSVQYVKAEISTVVRPSDAEGQLNKLYRYATSTHYCHQDKDICLLVYKLTHQQIQDVFEFSSQAKKWLFSLRNLVQSHDVIAVSANIYLHLIGITPEEDNKVKIYRSSCLRHLDSLSKETSAQRLEALTLKYLYLLYSIEYMDEPILEKYAKGLWDGILEELKNVTDPRLFQLYIDTFLLVTRHYNETKQEMLGVSLPLSVCGILSWTKKKGITLPFTYYSLYEAFEEFLYFPEGNSIMDKLVNRGLPNPVAFRLGILKVQEKYYPDGFYIKNKIARILFDMGDIPGAISYANDALNLTKPNDLSNPAETINYIDIRLILVKPYYMVGRKKEADEILADSSVRIGLLSELYDASDRNIQVDGIIDLFNNLMIEFEQNPYYKRELRLDYVLEEIIHLNPMSDELKIFYNKWRPFLDAYVNNQADCDNVLMQEFESDDFPTKLEQIASRFQASTSSNDIESISYEDMEIFCKLLVREYENWYNENHIDRSPHSSFPFFMLLPPDELLADN